MALTEIGRSVSESYCERMGSIRNQAVDEGTMLLSDSFLEKIIVLKMNNKLMKHVMTKYPQSMERSSAKK
jgi:hypothetical protein